MVLVGVSSPGSKVEVGETCSANNEKLIEAVNQLHHKIPEHVTVADEGSG